MTEQTNHNTEPQAVDEITAKVDDLGARAAQIVAEAEERDRKAKIAAMTEQLRRAEAEDERARELEKARADAVKKLKTLAKKRARLALDAQTAADSLVTALGKVQETAAQQMKVADAAHIEEPTRYQLNDLRAAQIIAWLISHDHEAPLPRGRAVLERLHENLRHLTLADVLPGPDPSGDEAGPTTDEAPAPAPQPQPQPVEPVQRVEKDGLTYVQGVPMKNGEPAWEIRTVV